MSKISNKLLLYFKICLLWVGCRQATVWANEPVPATGQGGQTPLPMKDIHDIKPLVTMATGWPWGAIGLVLLAAAVILALFLYWRRRKLSEITAVVAELPPEVNAHRALDQISDVYQVDGKLFYYTISGILRRYLYERFQMNAPEMTTEELIPQLEKLNLSDALFGGLTRLCHGADPIKYARKRPEVRQMEADLSFARMFVDGTTPKEEAPPDKNSPTDASEDSV